MTTNDLYRASLDRGRNGSPYDRGRADSYYDRSRAPHWYPEGTYKGTKITAEQMTSEQIEEYESGYDWNEVYGDKKDWN